MSRTRAGQLAAWGSAWLAGHASYDAVLEQVTGTDEPHQAVDETGQRMPLGWLLGQLRSRGVTALTLALPAPGDPRGLPAGTPFATAAMAAGEAVLGVGERIGLVPAIDTRGSNGDTTRVVTWQLYALDQAAPDAPRLAEAEEDLAAALRESTETLAALDVASWRPGVADLAASMRHASHSPLPPSQDPRAVRLLAQAERLDRVLQLAAADAPGGALNAQEAGERAAALRHLETAVRRARVAAYSAGAGRPASRVRRSL